MPIIDNRDYKPPLYCRNGHSNTIMTFYLRSNPAPSYQTTLYETKDGDVFKLDTLTQSSDRAAILLHGLEGSSQSQYLSHTAQLLYESGWDVYALNFRGCGDVDNRKLTMYHSGFTHDLHEVVEAYCNEYESIGIVGFSLGGNVVLKYMSDGIYPIDDRIRAACAISTPCDLHAGSIHIGKKQNYFYEKSFIKSLSGKVMKKHKLFPDKVDITPLSKIKSLYEFDDIYTGPIHGFRDAADYYAQCHSKQFLHNLRTPTMIINALDDPFLPEACYPFAEAKENENLFLLTPKYGGHVGYFSHNKYFWDELMIKKFLDDPSMFL